jgi:hypothetical protein
MDEANAELVDPPRRRIDLSRLMGRMAGEYRLALADRNVTVTEHIEPALYVQGGEELLETVGRHDHRTQSRRRRVVRGHNLSAGLNRYESTHNRPTLTAPLLIGPKIVPARTHVIGGRAA